MRVVVFNPYFESLGGGEKVLAAMAERLTQLGHNVTFLVKNPVNVTHVEQYFNVTLKGVTFTPLPPESVFVRLLSSKWIWFPGRWKSIIYDFSGFRSLKKIPCDLFINGLYQSSVPSPIKKSIYMCMFPQKLEPGKAYHSPLRKLYNRFTDVLESMIIGSRRKAINSYQIITANSKYTASWIKKYWNRDAMVVYPACDDMGPPAVKKSIIFSVGRFFADNGSSHHKRHDQLIKAFVRLNRKDWELHLAGSAAEDRESVAYLEGLFELAKDHANIHIHPNMPFKEIVELRRKGAIYWHATGLGYEVNTHPENQEHFGMVTVEAMSAGAVPVVYKSAGQLEVVDEGKNGLFWTTVDELLEQTELLINNPKLRQKLSVAAIKRARDFNREAFVKRVDQLIIEITNE
jgi:glycosyltransferase involved in cell wall biosynthesis